MLGKDFFFLFWYYLKIFIAKGIRRTSLFLSNETFLSVHLQLHRLKSCWYGLFTNSKTKLLRIGLSFTPEWPLHLWLCKTLWSVMQRWPFWSILVHLLCNLTIIPWPVLTPIPFWMSTLSRNRLYQDPVTTNVKYFAQSCYGDFGQFWSILVHSSATHMQPCNPSMTCTDPYPLSSVTLF